MAYSLTVAGYTFQNPPEEYRKLARLSNSPQTAFNRRSTAFYQSDSQDLQFQVEGTLALDPPLGEPSDDLAELEELQDLAISGGEVQVDFDPFFSGKAVIEDDPFRQSEGESTYSFTFSVNSESTDDTAYPAHSSPDTGNTFELGDLDLGYDPSEVSQNYERQTEKVKRLQGIARTVDTEGLIPKVTVSGLIDGGGQATLWDQARSNTLAYLSAEFQNGWALLDSLSIRNAPEAPDYLTGLFRYDMDLLIVMDPSSGIGETSKYVDQDVQGQTQYVSNCDEDGVFERLGDDTEDYPYALDYRVSGGTGKLDSEYIEWPEEFGTLDQSTTNYIWVEDGDGDGYGQVNTGTSGFPGSSVPLFEVDTGTSSVNDIRDMRSCLTGTRLDYDSLGDLNFTDDLAVSDQQFSFERLLALADAMSVSDPIERWLGTADLTETLSLAEGPLEQQFITHFTDIASVSDGGSASSGGGGGGIDETITWGTASDWDNAASETGVVHGSNTNRDGYVDDAIRKGIPDAGPSGNAIGHYPLDESSGVPNDVSGNGNDAIDYQGFVYDSEGLTGTSGFDFDTNNGAGSNSYVQLPNGIIGPNFSWTCIVAFKTRDKSVEQRYLTMRDDVNFYPNIGRTGTGTLGVRWDKADFNLISSSNFQENHWYIEVFAYDDSVPELRCWVDGVKERTISRSSQSDSYNNLIGQETLKSGSYQLNGPVDMVAFLNGAVSDTVAQEITAALRGTSTLESGTKSFSANTKPDLQNLAYTLNGLGIDLDVIGSPGTASEEVQTVTLDGSASFDLSWASDHQDFRIRPDLDNSADETGTPQFSQGELKSEGGGGGGDADQNPNTQWEIQGAKYDTSGNEYEGGGVTSRYGG